MKYIIGLDVGIASVGWSVASLDENEEQATLLNAGVRIFPKAEEPKTGASLFAKRCEKRTRRRTVRRKTHRLLRAKRLLQRIGLPVKNLPINTWQLRVKGLDKKLSKQEWSAVLLHILKHRGYYNPYQQKEDGVILTSLQQNKTLLNQYRTPAEVAVKHFLTQSGHIRNQQGSYLHTFDRADIKAELIRLFDAQKKLGNQYTKHKEQFLKLFTEQRPAVEDVSNLIGKCTHEKEELRASKHAYSSERFLWLTKLNNLRLSDGRALTESERELLLPLPYQKAKLTYKQVRKVLGLPESMQFKGIEDESATLMELKGYHAMQKCSNELNAKQMDDIATAFTLYKTESKIRSALQDKIASKTLDILLETINFNQTINLSLVCLHQILPYMEKGLRYDEACAICYPKQVKDKSKLLPPVDKNELTNPVVLRAISQTRKVINSIIRQYGTPAYVHIETARELGKSFEERQKIKRQQEKNHKEKLALMRQYNLSSSNLLKLRLFEQQKGICFYSGKALDKNKLFDANYVQVDHVFPFSKTQDDSFNNKLLVLTKENQNKRNQTPYEYLGQDWNAFVKRVQQSDCSPQKKAYLIKQTIDDDFISHFISQNLNDTRYIARFLMSYIDDHLFMNGKGKQKVFSIKGAIVAGLRYRWGLPVKNRGNHLHHAIDAAVIACYRHYHNIDEEIFQKIFVSHAPNRRMSGEGHQETIRSAKRLSENISVSRVPLNKLKLKDLESMVNKEREPALYERLKARLKQYNDDPSKAFATPFYKGGKRQIKYVKLFKTQKTGVLVRGGIADNGDMIRTDVYYKDERYYFVPVYAWQIAKKILPTRAITTGKIEKDWVEVTSDFAFLFSLFQNDLVEIRTQTRKELGYYRGIHRSTGQLSLMIHDSNEQVSISAMNAVSFEKHDVDILGNIY